MDELDDSLGAKNPHRFFPAVHRHRLENSEQADDVITVKVRDEDVALFVESERCVDDRSLATLSAVKKRNDTFVGDRDA